MLHNDFQDRFHVPFRKPVALRQLDHRFKPNLRFAVRPIDVYMHPRLFAREEIEAELAFA